MVPKKVISNHRRPDVCAAMATVLWAAPRIALVRSSKRIVALISTAELMTDLGRPRGDTCHLALWEGSGQAPSRRPTRRWARRAIISVPRLARPGTPLAQQFTTKLSYARHRRRLTPAGRRLDDDRSVLSHALGKPTCTAQTRKPAYERATNAPSHACDAPPPACRSRTPNRWRVASHWIWNVPTFAGLPSPRSLGAMNR